MTLMILVTLPSERDGIHGRETRIKSGWVIAPDTMVVPELEVNLLGSPLNLEEDDPLDH
jgi:hypothetical protein